MIRWLTDRVGTAAFEDPDVRAEPLTVVDVRILGDRPGNDPAELSAFISQAAAALERGERVVVCCDMGVSRSNAIAVGALVAAGHTFDDALQTYLRSGEETAIDPYLLRDVRAVVEPLPEPTSAGDGVLVIGGTGYIGSRLVPRLASDRPVVLLDRSRHDLTRDILSIERDMQRDHVGTIVHLGHPRRRNSLVALGESVAFTRGVIELGHLHGCHVVYASTLNVYSGEVGTHVAKADDPPRPKGVYAESKFLSEQLIEQHRSRGLGCTIARIGAVYGPGMERTTFVRKFFEWACAGEAIVTHRYRNGEPAFDFVYVDDIVDGLERVVTLRPGGVVHLGTGVLTSTSAVARAVQALVGSDDVRTQLGIDDDVARSVVDPDEATQVLGWTAKVDLEHGLAAMWDAISREVRA